MSDSGWDYMQESNDWMQVSNQAWDASFAVTDYADQLWYADDTYEAMVQYQNADTLEWASNQAYANSWEAYYGPVNAEGYTAYDASQGYTTSDTSLIEPATSASSTSLISDNSGSSNL